MGNIVAVVIIIIIIVLVGSNAVLRREHPGEIYTIWYAFSLSFLIFGALSLIAESSGKDLTDTLGPHYAPMLRSLYGVLTNFSDELILVGTVVGIAIGPQLLAYLLCAPSGTAKPPILVERITFLATLSVVKFLAVWAAIVLSHAVARALFHEAAGPAEFIQGAM